jgi:hypothetical protein
MSWNILALSLGQSDVPSLLWRMSVEVIGLPNFAKTVTILA